MKYMAIVIFVLVQGCSMYENAVVDPEIRKFREVQRINEYYAETHLKEMETRMEEDLHSIKIRDLVENF